MNGYRPSTEAVAKRINTNVDDGPHGRIEFNDGEKPYTLDASTAMDLAEALLEALDAIDELLADWRTCDPLASSSLIYQRAQHALDVARVPAPILTPEAAK